MKKVVILLRFPFSIFLLPVFLFATFYAQHISNLAVHGFKFWLCFSIWHLLVYPASNGYNSYNDRDSGPIGGLKAPPAPNELLRFITIGMDILALFLSAVFFSMFFALGVMIYIIMSRAYSYRKIRLKKYPILGYLTVVVFQGAWTFCTTLVAFGLEQLDPNVLLGAIISSCLIGAMYPLTQIYQHEEDEKDGVTSISYKLGLMGTFVLSASMFILGFGLMGFFFTAFDYTSSWLFLQLCLLPSLLFFFWWAMRVKNDSDQANFKNTMTMTVLSSIGLIVGFILIIVF